LGWLDARKIIEESALYLSIRPSRVAMEILIADDFFDIRLHDCSSESLCRRMSLGINWFQF